MTEGDTTQQRQPTAPRRRGTTVRGLVLRSVIVLSVLAALAIAEFFVFEYQTRLFENDAALINMSGRQRLILARIGQRVRQLADAETPQQRREAQERLLVLVEQMEHLHLALMHGDDASNVPRPPDTVHAIYFEKPFQLQRQIQPFLLAVRDIATRPGQTPLSLDEPPVPTVLRIAEGEELLLGFDAITQAYEQHIAASFTNLKLLWRGVLLTTLLTLGLAWLIAFRPMIERVRNESRRMWATNDQLQQHTQQLEQTLVDLEASRAELSDRSLAMLSIMEDLEGERKKLAAEIKVRERAERDLRASEERFRELAETVRLIPWEADADLTRFTYVGPQAEQILGYPIDEWHEPDFLTRHLHPSDRDYDMARFGEMARKHDHFEIELRMITADGHMLWLHNLVRVVRDDGDAGTLRGFMIDITDRREAEQQIYHERERLDRMVATAQVGIVFADSEGRFFRTNDYYARLTGYSIDELCGGGVTLADLTAPEYADLDAEALRQLMTTGRAGPFEKEYIRKDGKRVPVLVTAARLLGEEDERVAFVVDLTERKRAEERLRASEERTRLIVDTALDAVVTMNPDGEVTGWNPQAEQVFGWSRDEAIGQVLAELIIPKQYRDAHRRGLQRFLEEGKGNILNRRIELTALRRDGSQLPVELAIVPIRLGDSWEFCGFLRDISERIEFEQSLKQANAELEQTNQEMEQFVYTASHDLKSPIVTMLGFLGLMRNDVEAGKVERLTEFINHIERAGLKMRRCIEELLELSRIGRVPNNPEDVSLDELLRGIVDGHAGTIEENGVRVDIDDDLPVVHADRNRLFHLFDNLFTNALKYGCDNDSPVIKVGHERDDHTLRLCVSDNGKGIRPEYHDRVFELFQRLDNSIEGTGMGLAIVRRIAEMHGGAVRVESDGERGATFWVELPVSLLVSQASADR